MPGQFFKPPYQRLLEVENQRDEMLAALIVAREFVSNDRNAFAEANTPPNGGRIDPYDRSVLADYDAALLQIDAAIAKATASNPT